MGPHAMKKRALKSGRKKRQSKSNADPKLYHGARGRYHFFLCQQLLLRKQIVALTHLWKLPPEYEVICRDIWALHLSLLPNPPPPEPYIFAQANRDGVENDVDETTITNLPELKPESDGQSWLEEKPDQTAENQDDQDSEKDDDSDLEELMRENSELSCSSEDSEQENQLRVTKKTGKNRARHAYEGPASTIAVLIVASWILRIPVLYRDFLKVIESYELPYLDPVRFLPSNMTSHLTKHHIQALSPFHAPKAVYIHRLASRLCKRLHLSYGLFTPEANAGPILWRVVKAMGGTPTLYILTKRLASILSIPLTLTSLLAAELPRVKKHDPLHHQFDNIPPEVGLMAACIVVLKMVYGLDGRPRSPKDGEDPACALPCVDEYLKVLREMDIAEAKSKGKLFDSRNAMQIGELSEAMLDDYLLFCEKALLVPGGDEDGTLRDYFPLEEGHGSRVTMEAGHDRTRGALRAAVAVEEGFEVLRPGEEHGVWNSRDVLGTLPEEYRIVLDRGARWVGVEAEYLGGVIEQHERGAARWWKRKDN